MKARVWITTESLCRRGTKTRCESPFYDGSRACQLSLRVMHAGHTVVHLQQLYVWVFTAKCQVNSTAPKLGSTEREMLAHGVPSFLAAGRRDQTLK